MRAVTGAGIRVLMDVRRPWRSVILRVVETRRSQQRAAGLTNDTTRLFGLDGVAVTSVRLDEDDNPMLALVTVDDQARCCPDCGGRSQDPHSCVTTTPRDLPVAGRRTQ